jgi:hypothetical protein
MPSELPDTLTPITRTDILKGLVEAWGHLFGTEAKKESICILGSQWCLETGNGKSMHCFNLGNVKSTDGDGHDFTFFGCGEELSLGVAQHAAQTSPLVKIKRVYSSNNVQMASVWVEPKHPWCRFRAFHTLSEGAVDYISLLNKRFKKAWPAVLSGDPALFSHYLRQEHYYTADENQYTASLVSLFHTLTQITVDYTYNPDLTDDQKTRIQNLVALTMIQSIDDTGDPSESVT